MSAERLQNVSRDVFSKFTENEERVASDGAADGDHLCVLIHGLWGNPKHLSYVASALRVYHPDLHILVPKTNSEYFTYDGIDLGAYRTTAEIEHYVAYLEQKGSVVRRLSIIGYSLGGLIARYSIGLLYSKGFFNQVEPVNFTTFATPHIGVRTPITGFGSRFWNFMGSATLSLSGRQIFVIDSFRDTGKPLLSLLADPESIFIKGLQTFPRRVLYANIINDRSAPYFTTAIANSDPFVDLERLSIKYLPGLSPIILDLHKPVKLLPQTEESFMKRLAARTPSLQQLPWFAFVTFIFIFGVPIFLFNALIQSFRSKRRIQLHEKSNGNAEINFYRAALLDGKVADVVKRPFTNGSLEDASSSDLLLDLTKDGEIGGEDTAADVRGNDGQEPMANQIDGFPKLALCEEQVAMIQNLDTSIGFKKYRVHIHKVRHSHAAIIVRPRPAGESGFDEGKVVIKHWLENEFEP